MTIIGVKKRRHLHIVIGISFVLLCYLILSFYSIVIAQRAKNLYNFALSDKSVNIHIGEFKSADKAKDVNAQGMIEALRRRLTSRRSANFNIVENIEDAGLSVTGTISEFVYLKKDPIDIFIPLGLVIDVATNKNYARLGYEISVLDCKKNKVVWKKRLKATITEFDMPEGESIPLIMDRAAYVFIKECFGKPSSKVKKGTLLRI